MKLGQAIKTLRINKAKQGQKVFSQNIGITQTYLSQIENDLKEPSIKVLQSISDYLEIPVSILFWYTITEDEIKPDKQQYFKVLKPAIDSLINCFF